MGAGSNTGGEFALAKANGFGERRTFRDRVLAGGAGGRGEGLIRSSVIMSTGMGRMHSLLYLHWLGSEGIWAGLLARYFDLGFVRGGESNTGVRGRLGLYRSRWVVLLRRREREGC